MNEIIFSLNILLDRFILTSPYLGAVTLQRNGREYILDVTQSYVYDDDDCNCGTTIQCDLSNDIDDDTFPDCPFDLTVEDLLSEDLVAMFYIAGEDEEFEVDKMSLHFTIDGERKSIKVIED